MSTLNPLRVRSRLGRREWGVPVEFGPDGWRFQQHDADDNICAEILTTVADHDGVDWIHASMVVARRMPTYDELCHLHQAVFEDRWSYQVFAPREHHVNIHAGALHLWGRLDGQPSMPNFGAAGSI